MGKDKPLTGFGFVTLEVRVFEAREARAGEIEARVRLLNMADTVTINTHSVTKEGES